MKERGKGKRTKESSVTCAETVSQALGNKIRTRKQKEAQKGRTNSQKTEKEKRKQVLLVLNSERG